MLILTIGVSTVEQANVFLGVEDQTPDDFVMTMYTAKVCFSIASFVSRTPANIVIN